MICILFEMCLIELIQRTLINFVRGSIHCTAVLLFDWFGFSCFAYA